jgi:hypothetical protein
MISLLPSKLSLTPQRVPSLLLVLLLLRRSRLHKVKGAWPPHDLLPISLP